MLKEELFPDGPIITLMQYFSDSDYGFFEKDMIGVGSFL